MKKTCITLSIISILGLFSACSNDDSSPVENDNDPQETENFTVAQAVTEITTHSTTGWKFGSVTLNNDSVSDLDIATLFNVQDDRFSIEPAAGNGLQLTWSKGYEINTNAVDRASVMTDENRSLEEITISSTTADNAPSYEFNAANGQFKLNYSPTNQSLTGTIRLARGSGTLNVSLVPVTQQDSDRVLTPGTFTKIFSMPAAQPLITLKFSRAQNSLYAMASDFGTTSNFNTQLVRFQEDTEAITTLDQGLSYNAENEFEFIDNKIKMVSNFGGTLIDYDLSNSTSTASTDFSSDSWYRYTSVNNEIISIGGYGGYTSNSITRLALNGNSFLELGQMPSERTRADGEIIGNKLFVFAGFYIDPMGNFTYQNDILEFDYTTGLVTNSYNLPLPLVNTFTARQGNIIYVAGRALLSTGSNGNIGATRPFLGAFNVFTKEFNEIDITALLPTDRRLKGFTVSDSNMYFGFEETNPANGFWVMDVYQAPVN